jgi:hypothetical protein
MAFAPKSPVRGIVGQILTFLCMVAAAGCGADGSEATATRWNSPSSGNSSTHPPVASAPTVGISGNCNASGHQIYVSCTFPSKSLARIAIEPSTVTSVWFDGPPRSLPEPPTYRAVQNPCGDWKEWLRSTPGFYFDGPEIDVGLFEGSNDSVVLTRVDIVILQREPMVGDGTWIMCLWGGDGPRPFQIEVNTATASTIVTRVSSDGDIEDPARPMPPAFISPTGETEAVGSVVVQSLPGYRYHGYIIVSATVNGEPWSTTVGSEERPLRWITTGASDQFEPDVRSYYMWDRRSKKWIMDFNPLTGRIGDN